MTNREIYRLALHLLAQQADSEENEDLEERAPYLLASFCSEASEVDRYLRQSEGLGGAVHFTRVCIGLDEPFPLLERLAPLGGLYLAAMLALDEDNDLSDRLYERYCDGMTALQCGIPAAVESITNLYDSV